MSLEILQIFRDDAHRHEDHMWKLSFNNYDLQKVTLLVTRNNCQDLSVLQNVVA